MMPEVNPNDFDPSSAVGTPAPASGEVNPKDFDKPGVKPSPMQVYRGVLQTMVGMSKAPLRNAIPISGQVAGQTAGELAGAALAPYTMGLSEIALPPLGAGLANMGTSKLPEKYGGTPSESKKSAFLWGAIPALISGGVKRPISKAIAAKTEAATAQDAAEFAKRITQEAEQGPKAMAQAVAPEVPARASIVRAANATGAAPNALPPLGQVEANTAATTEAIDSITGPIQRMSEERGKPIGEAYTKLKNPTEPLTPQEAQAVSDSARNIKQDLISPAPKAAAILKRLAQYGMAESEPSGQLRAVETTFGGAETIGRGANRAVAPTAFRNLSPEQIDAMQTESVRLGRPLNAEEMAKYTTAQTSPPTRDETRELRQYVEGRARSATGGDRYALNRLKHDLDKVLLKYLPDNMGEMRARYQGFIKNYENLNSLRRAGTPETVGRWFYGQPSEIRAQIIKAATPDEREQYRALFNDQLYSRINPDMPVSQQIQILKKAASPYLTDGTTNLLFGAQAPKAISDAIYMPAKRAEAAAALRSPQSVARYMKASTDLANKSGKYDLAAATAGYNAVVNALPPEMQTTIKQFVEPVAPGEAIALPSARQSLARSLQKPSRVTTPQFAVRYGVGQAAMDLGGAGGTGAGGGSFMMRAVLGFLIMARTASGWDTIMKQGGADLLAKMYTNPAPAAMADATFKTMVAFGGRVLHERKQPQEAPNAASGR